MQKGMVGRRAKVEGENAMKKRLGRRIGVALLSIALLAQEISLPAWASESVSGTNDTALV